MQKLVDIFKELNSTNSVVDKEKILFKYKNDEQLKEVLEANLNPHRLFQFNEMPSQFDEKHYQAFKSNPHDKGWTEQNCHDCFISMLVDLEKRHTTGNKAKETVTAVMKFFPKDQFDLYAKILTKESIGVGAKTVNKVWPNLIPEFKLMLAPNELPVITKVNYPIYIQPKLDGYRCVYKEGQLISRAGKSFGNKNLSSYFNNLFQVDDYVLDGELYVEGGDFNKLQTILNTYDAPLPNGLKYFVYDCMPKADWISQSTKKPYSERLKLLRTVLNNQVADHKKVIDIANDLVETSKEAVDIYKKYLKDGYEGCMLKSPEGLYKWKRTTVKSGEMLKMKPFETIDLIIKGVYAGEGKFEGMAGGVDVDYNGVSVAIGSGFDVATRKALTAAPNDYIGKTIEVKYFEETEDGSLRFPTFVRFREEKD